MVKSIWSLVQYLLWLMPAQLRRLLVWSNDGGQLRTPVLEHIIPTIDTCIVHVTRVSGLHDRGTFLGSQYVFSSGVVMVVKLSMEADRYNR